jgi:hypothetical protein
MTARLRKLGLTVHIIVSVGWVGAVTAFLLLSVSALASDDAAASRAAYLAMDVVGRGALLPLSVGALTSGIAQSLGTKWGLFKHYWVLVKLVLTVFATAALFLHQFTTIAEAARLASDAANSGAIPLRQLGLQLRADAGLALVVLLAITAIAVYKPWGLVGQVSRSLRLFLAAITAILVAFVALHLSGRTPHQHSH